MKFVRLLFKTCFFIVFAGIFLAIILFGLSIWAFPRLGPSFLNSWLEGKTGFSLVVKEIKYKAFAGKIDFYGFSIYNPSYYPTNKFLNFNHISAKVKNTSLIKKPIYFEYITIDLEKIALVRNADGSMNALEFTNAFKKKTTQADSPKTLLPEPNQEKKSPQNSSTEPKKNIFAKRFIIKIKSLDMLGLPGSENEFKTFELNYRREFNEVEDLQTVAKLIAHDLREKGASILADLLAQESAKYIQQELKNAFKKKLIGKLWVKNDEESTQEEGVSKEIEKGLKKIFSGLKKL